jgi:hypothetical protein
MKFNNYMPQTCVSSLPHFTTGNICIISFSNNYGTIKHLNFALVYTYKQRGKSENPHALATNYSIQYAVCYGLCTETCTITVACQGT